MILMPLTWAYAILRYRLMDVDIIFQQGYVYTLATLVVLGIFYGLIFSFARPDDLSPADWNRLAKAIQASLKYSLGFEAPEGRDEIRYVEERGAPNPFKIYGHEGEPCPRCGTAIRREAQGQRSTFFCPHCQAGQARATRKSRRSSRARASASSARRKRD
jgi:formamidopyrimidine-DNA glycosylase